MLMLKRLILAVLIGAIIFVLACSFGLNVLQRLDGGPLDVTFDPSYRFTPVAGTTWKSKIQLVLVDSSARFYLRPSIAFDVEEHQRALADPNYRNGGERAVMIFEPGTLIKIDRLINIRGTMGFLVVHGSFPSPPYAGKDIELSDDLFEKNDFSLPGRSLPRTWIIASDKLEKP